MYNELYKVWRLEKTSELPQPLPSDFYNRAAAYLKDLDEKGISNTPQGLQDRLALKEKEVAERLLEEIRQARLRKITNTSLKGTAMNLQDLTDKEKTLVESLQASTAEFGEVRVESSNVDTPLVEVDLTVVRFLQDSPEIVGVDLKMYGPYKKEDVASLPKQNAEAFIKQGAAKSIDVKQATQ